VLLTFTLAHDYQFQFITETGRLGIGHELRMGRILFSSKACRDQFAFTLLLRRNHPHVPYGNQGPLPHLVCTLLYAWLLVVSTTGILIAAPHADGGVEAWGASLLRPIEVWLSGITTVRNVHRFVMWWFVCFTLAHVYMAVWNSMRTGNLVIEGIISGFEAESVDVREYDPTADERKGTGKA